MSLEQDTAKIETETVRIQEVNNTAYTIVVRNFTIHYSKDDESVTAM